MTMTQPSKIWNRQFTSVFIANACMYLAQQMMTSLVAKYADHLGAAATVVGIVSSMFAVTALGFKVVSGTAIDTFNRRIILMGAMSVMAAAFFGYSLSRNIPMLIISRLIQGTGQAFTATCCLALAADTLPPGKIGSGIGVFSMAQAASQAVGPAVALTLVDRFGYNATFAVGGCTMLFAAFIASRVKIPFKKTKKFRISIQNIIAKEAIMPAAIMFFLSMTACVINSFLIIFAGVQHVSNIGYYFTVYAGTLLLTRPMAGYLSDRYGLVRVLIPAMIFFSGAFILISFSSSLFMFLIAAFISAFGYGACHPAIQTLSMKCVPAERRGAASSTNYVGTDLGNLAGPVIAGFLVDRFGYESMWRIMIFPVGIALIIVLAGRVQINRIVTEFQNRQTGNRAPVEKRV
jgi:MFS family permease